MMSKEFNVQAEAELPEILYHYTTAEGLKGIIENKSLHFTEIFFLNDYQELKLGLDLIEKKLESEIISKEQMKINLTNFYELSKSHHKQFFIYYLDEISKTSQFIISFTDSVDNLSHWRGYCPNGGYAIGFDIKLLLETNSKIKFFSPKKVNYSKEVFQDSFSLKIESIFNKYESILLLNELNPDLTKLKEQFLLEIFETLMDCTFLKHPKFNSENEWRIRAFSEDLEKDLKFRVKRTLIVPFIEIPITNLNCIKEIWVGPTIDKDLAFRSLRLLAIKNQIPLNSIQFNASDIPYREF